MSSDTLRWCSYPKSLFFGGGGVKELDTSITKEREVVRYVKSSPNKNQTFKSFMNILSIDSKLEIIENFEKVFP